MLVQPSIQEVARRLRQLVDDINGRQPQIPQELLQDLNQVCQRLTTHVVELSYQKRNLFEAWTRLEHQ